MAELLVFTRSSMGQDIRAMASYVETERTDRGGIHATVVFPNGWRASILREPEPYGFARSYGTEMIAFKPDGRPALEGHPRISPYDGGVIPWIESQDELYGLLRWVAEQDGVNHG